MLARYLNQKTSQNVAQHNILVNNFIADIANTLKSYGMNSGYTLSDQFYSDLAWGD